MHVSSAPRLDGAKLHFCSPFKRLLLPRKTCGDFIGGLSEVLAREPMGSEKEWQACCPSYPVCTVPREGGLAFHRQRKLWERDQDQKQTPRRRGVCGIFLLLLGLSVPGYFLFKTASTSSVISCPPYSTADLSNTAGMDFCVATVLIAC